LSQHPALCAATALVAAAALACNGTDEEPNQVLMNLVVMLPVPPLDSDSDWLLVGKYEVTRAQFEGVGITANALPVVFVSRLEATAWAQQHGMRLPTKREWLHFTTAGNPGREIWGGALSGGTANVLELQAHRLLAVGVFELGKNDWGLYDTRGNAWEWLADDLNQAPHDFFGTNVIPHAQAAGGSYANLTPALAGQVRVLEAGEKADDLGFRVVIEAIPWMREQLLPLWSSPGLREEMSNIFASWDSGLCQQLADRAAELGLPEDFCLSLAAPVQ